MREVAGRFILVNELNQYFEHVTRMLLHHFDHEAWRDTVFILGTYVHVPMHELNARYPGKRVIAYQLEPMFQSDDTWQPVERVVEHLRSACEIWDMDELNATYLGWQGIRVDRIEPMRFTPSLKDVGDVVERDIDVLFYGYLNERRYRILRAIEPHFYDKHSLIWCYGVPLAQLPGYLARSRIVLNLHVAEPYNRQEQVRIFYPLINARCVVSETSERNYFGDAIVEADPERLPEVLLDLLGSGRWKAQAEAGARRFEAAAATEPRP